MPLSLGPACSWLLASESGGRKQEEEAEKEEQVILSRFLFWFFSIAFWSRDVPFSFRGPSRCETSADWRFFAPFERIRRD